MSNKKERKNNIIEKDYNIMEENLLHYNSIIESEDKYNGKIVSDLIDKKSIFQMIKKGYRFDDEVLKRSNITKTIRDRRAYYIIAEHEKDTKKYKKETATLSEIFDEIENNEYAKYDSKIEDDNENNEMADYETEN